VYLSDSGTPVLGTFGSSSFLANGTESIFIWGAQLE
jgi:hypothetical protein